MREGDTEKFKGLLRSILLNGPSIPALLGHK